MRMRWFLALCAVLGLVCGCEPLVDNSKSSHDGDTTTVSQGDEGRVYLLVGSNDGNQIVEGSSNDGNAPLELTPEEHKSIGRPATITEEQLAQIMSDRTAREVNK